MYKEFKSLLEPEKEGEAALSRRALLRGVAVVAGGAAVLAGTVMPAEAKMSQKAAGYQATAKDGASCASCALFKAPSTCSLVDGTVAADGWCRFYSKKS
jgi:hypothetical protein